MVNWRLTGVDPKLTWAAIGVLVLAHNLSAADGKMLSEQVDRWLVTHPFVTRAVIAVLAVHLANLVPAGIDPISATFTYISGQRGACLSKGDE